MATPNPRLSLAAGMKLFKLTLLEKVSPPSGKGRLLWNCRCECGAERVFPSMNLGRTVKSCGCLKSPDLTGLRFGKLVVLKKEGKRAGRSTWRCRCDCGREKTVSSSSLKTGSVKSCGCLRTQTGPLCSRWKGAGALSASRLLRYLHGAAKRELPFDLTVDDAWEVFEKQKGLCALTGLHLHLPTAGRGYSKNESTASLDRIDSQAGYCKANVQWVHRDVNMMKNAFSEDRFIGLCRLVVEHTKNRPCEKVSTGAGFSA